MAYEPDTKVGSFQPNLLFLQAHDAAETRNLLTLVLIPNIIEPDLLTCIMFSLHTSR